MRGLNDHLSDPVKGGDVIAGFYYLFKMRLSLRKCLEHLTDSDGQFW